LHEVDAKYHGNSFFDSSVSNSTELTAVPSTPTINWSAPAPITYGKALSPEQLDAKASVPGSFRYSPAAGTVVSGGLQTLTATFLPTDSLDYTQAEARVTLTVNRAASSIRWSTPAYIEYGTELSDTQLNATSSLPGAFTYSPVLGAVPHAGLQTLTVTFTPSEAADYATSTAKVTLNVLKTTPKILWATPTAITYGEPLGSAQLDAAAQGTGSYAHSPVAGKFTYSYSAGTILSAGSHSIESTFTPEDAADYYNSTAKVSILVNRAKPLAALTTSANPVLVSKPVTFTATVSAKPGTPEGTVSFYDGTALLGSSPLHAGVANFTTSALATGLHSISAVYSGANNFLPVSSPTVPETVNSP
jgi:hypothetical protein